MVKYNCFTLRISGYCLIIVILEQNKSYIIKKQIHNVTVLGQQASLVVLSILYENIGVSCVIFLFFNTVKHITKFHFQPRDDELLKFYYLALH